MSEIIVVTLDNIHKTICEYVEKKEIKVGGKTNIEVNPDVEIGNFSGGMRTNNGNLH